MGRGLRFSYSLKFNNRRVTMSESTTAAPRRSLSLDVLAVTLALTLALLVRLNLIPPIRW
jgi:hypothetical protein